MEIHQLLQRHLNFEIQLSIKLLNYSVKLLNFILGIEMFYQGLFLLLVVAANGILSARISDVRSSNKIWNLRRSYENVSLLSYRNTAPERV